MGETLRDLLGDSGRGIVGALLLGMPLLYTMETWWIAGRLPTPHLLAYALLGLVAVFAVVHFVGFKPRHKGPGALGDAARDLTELVLHTFIASFGVLFLFGVVELTDDLQTILRMGLLQVVPLGFGAAIANHALGAEDGASKEENLLREMATFAAGAVFFAFPVAPTEEMELMAAHAGWTRMALILVFSVLLTYLALYELRFRGHSGRTMRGYERWGETFAGYAVAFTVCSLLLLGFGQFHGATFDEGLQKAVVLSFLGCLGGAAARVVI